MDAHHISRPNIKAMNLTNVVQSYVAHGYATDIDRLKFADRGQLPCTSDLPFYRI